MRPAARKQTQEEVFGILGYFAAVMALSAFIYAMSLLLK